MNIDDLSPEERQQLMAMMMREGSQPTQSGVAQPQQPQGGGGMSPGMAMQFIPESGGGASSGGAGAGGGESAMAGAAPWAALAAAIIANESWANSEGRRPDDFGDHMKDLASGKVLEYDAQALSDKMPGKSGELLEFGAEMGNPEGVLKNLKKGLMPWEWF